MKLYAKDLVKRYGARTVVKGVSIEVQQGEIVGLLGPNGAGKTTSFYMIVGLIQPNGGQIFLENTEITKEPVYKRAQQGLAYLAQEASVFRKMTVEDNIRAILEMTSLSKDEQKAKMEHLLSEFGLNRVRKSYGIQLSGGERRRCEIARALAIDPKFILLDEPFAGVDPIAVEDIQRIVGDLKNRNIGVIITDHNVDETLQITDRAYLLYEGSILKAGTPEELAADPEVRKKYLGTNFVLRKRNFNNDEADISEKYFAVPNDDDDEDNVSTLVEQMFEQQTRDWAVAAKNYEGLKSIQSREFNINGKRIIVQFNPERIRSSAAKVDEKSIKERRCFLCPANLPPEQKGIPVCNNFLILTNPFPIFNKHLTIPNVEHVDQRIAANIGVMLDLAKKLPDYVVFYNGPKCGASAPDHMHFQAGNKGLMPIEKEFAEMKDSLQHGYYKSVNISFAPNYLRRMITLESINQNDLVETFDKIYDLLVATQPAEAEPMLNILCYTNGNSWTLHIFPRIKHRPSQFYEEGEKQLLISPASVDFGGVFITPRAEDFEKITADDIVDMFNQITIPAEDFEKLTKEILGN